MNSEEGVSLAKMAVTVLLVVLVIGAVVAIVYKAYSWFNSGADKLGDQVNSLDSSAYSRYDDTQVSGTDVLTALKENRDSDLCIVIATSDSKDAVAYTDNNTIGGSHAYNYCAVIEGAPAASNGVIEVKDKVKYDTENGRWVVDKIAYDATKGMADRNTNFSPTQDKANTTNAFVKQGGKFYGNLIYSNDTGEVCGVLFRQMGK